MNCHRCGAAITSGRVTFHLPIPREGRVVWESYTLCAACAEAVDAETANVAADEQVQLTLEACQPQTGAKE